MNARTVVAIVLLGLLALCGCGSSAKAPKTASPACLNAQAAANAYAGWVANYTTYPDDSVSEGIAIQQRMSVLLDAMRKAGCPGSTLVDSLPGGGSS